jgi:hypothetical protein
MPPRAPEGVFDVRFVNGARLMEGDDAVVRLGGVQYPVQVAVSRMPAAYEGTAVIDMMVDGDVSETRVLQVHEKLVIENERVTALRIRNAGDPQGDLPERFSLRGNYPNPFNPQTTVVFNLPEDARVRVTLFDMLGRQVMTLPDAEFSSGAGRQISIDASSLASGMYLYQLKADMATRSEVQMGRMTLLK